MGLYLEPRVSDKKAWVQNNGVTVGEGVGEIDFDIRTVNEDEVLVCNVENFAFDATAVAYNESEFNAFNRPDGRNKTWVIIKKDVAKANAPMWETYMGEHNV